MRRAAPFALSLCLAAAAALPSFAQTKDRLDRMDALLGWEAVGRLDTGGGHCTAALITRDVALTAAHCVDGSAGMPEQMVFRAGYRDGTHVATRRVTDVVIAEGYMEARALGDKAGYIARDVALVRLESAIFEPGADPYALADVPQVGTELTLASYGQGRIEALTLERGCALETRYVGGILGITCDATFGSSGAPIFVSDGGRPQIMSLVSSGIMGASGESVETYGVALTGIVPELLEELRQRRALTPVVTGVTRLRVGERSGGGARFVKP